MRWSVLCYAGYDQSEPAPLLVDTVRSSAAQPRCELSTPLHLMTPAGRSMSPVGVELGLLPWQLRTPPLGSLSDNDAAA